MCIAKNVDLFIKSTSFKKRLDIFFNLTVTYKIEYLTVSEYIISIEIPGFIEELILYFENNGFLESYSNDLLLESKGFELIKTINRSIILKELKI